VGDGEVKARSSLEKIVDDNVNAIPAMEVSICMGLLKL
jgi:hypothetical protein